MARESKASLSTPHAFPFRLVERTEVVGERQVALVLSTAAGFLRRNEPWPVSLIAEALAQAILLLDPPERLERVRLAALQNVSLLQDVAHVGIIFLLFLLGLDMQPRALLTTMRNSTVVALASALLFALVGAGVAHLFGFTPTEALITGVAMMFSSTIIGIKLLPTTVLHHRRTGELMVGLLLLQDMIAILVLVALMGLPKSVNELSEKLGIPIAACYRRIRSLEKAGLLYCVDRGLTQKGKRVCLYKATIRNGMIMLEKNKVRVRLDMIDGSINNYDYDAMAPQNGPGGKIEEHATGM